ncbi:bifunctional metallophosphatase/5'-nucleotidase [Jatrophihabitans fulvus]
MTELSESRTVSRRSMLAGALVGGAGAALWGVTKGTGTADAAGTSTATISVLGTTDLHGHIYNWDYYKDAEYDDTGHNDVGVAKVATLIKAMRQERPYSLTLDAGDTIQGTPLTYYYAAIDPITGPKAPTHPMAAAMNAIGYDAAAIGNHEFNYGVPLLRKFQSQLHHPLLCANALDWKTRAPAFPEYVIKRVNVSPVPGRGRPNTFVNVGIVGLVTPGCAIWDKANLDGKITFNGIVEQAKKIIPKVKKAGADVVIVSCHSGATPSSSYGDALPWPENASQQLAEQVPGIDAILVGHAHVEIPQRYVTNQATGKQVLLCEPYYWGMRLAVMDLKLSYTPSTKWQVTGSSSFLLNSNTVDGDADVLAVSRTAHEKTLTYVRSVIGTATEAMSAATSRYEDTAAIDFINYVQADAVKKATGTTLPVLSIAAPFNKLAAIPKGEITVKDVAGLYIYDNTLEAIQFTGAQVKAYLEFSARYFKQVSGTGPFAPDDLTNAVTATAPNGTPDYNYDIMAGLDARLTYDIDVSAAPGDRIRNLAYGGKPVADGDQYVIAINNYRASGGGNFPGVTTAPVLYNAQVAITQLLIQWVTDEKVVDPSTFSSTDWRLVSGNTPIEISA